MAILWSESDLRNNGTLLSIEASTKIYERNKKQFSEDMDPRKTKKGWSVNWVKQKVLSVYPPSDSGLSKNVDEYTKKAIEYFAQNCITEEFNGDLLYKMEIGKDISNPDNEEFFVQLGETLSKWFPNFTFKKDKFRNQLKTTYNSNAIKNCKSTREFVSLAQGSFVKLRANLILLNNLMAVKENFSKEEMAEAVVDEMMKNDFFNGDVTHLVSFFKIINAKKAFASDEILGRIKEKTGVDNIEEAIERVKNGESFEEPKLEEPEAEEIIDDNSSGDDSLVEEDLDTSDELDEDELDGDELDDDELDGELDDELDEDSLDETETKEEEKEEKFSIKKRIKNTRKDPHLFKKIVYASLAGVGIISCIYLTFIEGQNPMLVISNCAETFKRFASGNIAFSGLREHMGDLVKYFASVAAGFGGSIALANVIAKGDSKKSDDNSSDDDSLGEEDLDTSDELDDLDEEELDDLDDDELDNLDEEELDDLDDDELDKLDDDELDKLDDDELDELDDDELDELNELDELEKKDLRRAELYEKIKDYVMVCDEISTAGLIVTFNLDEAQTFDYMSMLHEDGIITENAPYKVLMRKKVEPVDDAFKNIFANLESEGYFHKDELYEEIKDYIMGEDVASTSRLQRKFKLGYARAARYMDLLEADGIIGPYQGAKPREVLKRKKTEEVVTVDEIYDANGNPIFKRKK